MKPRMRLPLFELLLLVAGLLFVAPVVLILLNSFKTLAEINAAPLALPKAPTLEAYGAIFTQVKLARPMLHSLLMAGAVIVALITLAPMAAYGLSRRPVRGATWLRGIFLAGLVVPFQVVMVPLLMQLNWMGLNQSYVGLFLVYVAFGLPLAIFIYTGFLSTLPRELEEAAAMDGCAPYSTFWLIVYPLLSPCTVTIVIFWGLWVWNDFLAAFIFMGSTRGELAFVQLQRFLSDKYVKNWDTIFAGAVVLTLPVTILYLTMQRRLVKGLTSGAVK